MNLRHPTPTLCLRRSLQLFVSAVLLTGVTATTYGYTQTKNQSDVLFQSPLLSDVPGRTPALAETTIRHVVYFNDFDSNTNGWGIVNFRANQSQGWNIVSGTHACTGNSWWMGRTGLAHGDGYGNNWLQSLQTNVPINIAGANNTTLTFKMRLQCEFGFDWAWVLIKGGNAGARWDTLWSYSGDLGSTCSNQSIAIPDSFHTVTQPIAIRFLFGSDLTFSADDSTGAYSGWTIDDVTLKSGGTTHFSDDMESGPSKWLVSAPNPGSLWHIEDGPGTSQPATCFFLSTKVWVPFQGTGFGVFPDFSDAMITSPPMDLQGVFSPNMPSTTLRLQFDQWIAMPAENNVLWSLWISGSDDKVTWTSWANVFDTLELYGGAQPSCTEGQSYDFNPYDTPRTHVPLGMRYIRLAIRLRDEKVLNPCQCDGPLKLGVDTEGMYVDNFGVYYIYTITGVEMVSSAPTATRPEIRKTFPNPFNPVTTIEFSVPRSGPVRVGVYDVHGKRVVSLVNTAMGPGLYRVLWNGKDEKGSDVSSGVYFAHIESRGGSGSSRLALIK